MPYSEQVVALTRVDGKQVVEERPIQFDTKKRKTDASYEGETKVVEEGKVGIETRTLPRDLPRRQARLAQAGRASASPRSR